MERKLQFPFLDKNPLGLKYVVTMPYAHFSKDVYENMSETNSHTELTTYTGMFVIIVCVRVLQRSLTCLRAGVIKESSGIQKQTKKARLVMFNVPYARIFVCIIKNFMKFLAKVSISFFGQKFFWP